METKNEFMVIADKAMAAVFKIAELTYNTNKNILHTQEYTSHAGNTYSEGVRFSDRVIIGHSLSIDLKNYELTF